MHKMAAESIGQWSSGENKTVWPHPHADVRFRGLWGPVSGRAREIKGSRPDLLPRKSRWEANGKQTVKCARARMSPVASRRPGLSRN